MTALALPRRSGRFAALALLIIAISGCTTPETRLRTGLIEAGLSAPMAGCMAKAMTDRLSTGQLRKLGALHRASKVDLRDMSYAELTQQVRALGDPEIIAVTTSAAVRCTLAI
ncbi:MAG TPA: hypothetical protein VNS79_13175 [Sphingobium sp.]|nr:hypothetical protein [Sphingobium sp.]